MVKGHKIYVRHDRSKAPYRLSSPLIKKCIRVTLEIEGVDMPCEVSVLITGDDGIRELNEKFRDIDAPTDVISFPMLDFAPPGWSDPGAVVVEPGTGTVPLGEIVISAQRTFSQADEYGHSLERETAYLTIHSVLHLLGYYHTDNAQDKRLMRSREEKILKELGL